MTVGHDGSPQPVFEILIPVAGRTGGRAVLFSASGEMGGGTALPPTSEGTARSPLPSPSGRGGGRDAAPDVLGLWTALPSFDSAQDKPSPPGGTAFGTTATGEAPPTAEAPVWRANLPADPKQADRDLDRAEEGLEAAQQALDAAASRLDALAEERPSGLAFDVSATGAELPDPEQELLALLEEAKRGGPPVSFGAGEPIRGGWAQATQQFQAFVEQLQRIVSHYAWVETRVQGQLLGRTAVSWTGDMDTAWQAGLNPAQMALHQRTLGLALASRETLIRTFVVTASGAARLSVLLSTPGGAILALPAAYKFINQVRTELERHQQITQATKHAHLGTPKSGIA
jgi:hypothetical protein